MIEEIQDDETMTSGRNTILKSYTPNVEDSKYSYGATANQTMLNLSKVTEEKLSGQGVRESKSTFNFAKQGVIDNWSKSSGRAGLLNNKNLVKTHSWNAKLGSKQTYLPALNKTTLYPDTTQTIFS